MSAPWWRWDARTLILDIRVQPRARRDEVAGPRAGRLRVRISAPPVDGSANDRLVSFLAREFRVPRRRVSLISGARGRDKRVAVAHPAITPPWLGAERSC